MFKSILVATEGSEPAGRAVEAAARLARDLGARLSIAMVVDPSMAAVLHAWRWGEHDAAPSATTDPLLAGVPAMAIRTQSAGERGGREYVDEFAELILGHARELALAKGSPEPRVIAGHGDAVEVILEIAAAEEADLVVFGSRGLGVVKGLLLGSVSQQLSRLSPCPCLIVR